MFKKTNLLLLFTISTFLSCRDTVTECNCDEIYEPSTRGLEFGRLIERENYSSAYSINKCRVTDTIVLFCIVTLNDKIPIERIPPTLNVKVTTLNSGDTEYYSLLWYEPYRWKGFSDGGLCGSFSFIVIELRSFVLPIVYEPDKAITNDGLLTISPGGDQLYAEMIFQNKKYTAFLDVKPE